MLPCRVSLILALGLSLLTAPAVALPPDPAASPPMSGMDAPASGSVTPGDSHELNSADQDMMAGMRKMTQDMDRAPMTGDPDRDFVAMMIAHHQGAIDMARVELRYGKDPMLLRLSHDIVAAQTREIAQMQRWQISHRRSQ